MFPCFPPLAPRGRSNVGRLLLESASFPFLRQVLRYNRRPSTAAGDPSGFFLRGGLFLTYFSPSEDRLALSPFYLTMLFRGFCSWSLSLFETASALQLAFM